MRKTSRVGTDSTADPAGDEAAREGDSLDDQAREREAPPAHLEVLEGSKAAPAMKPTQTARPRTMRTNITWGSLRLERLSATASFHGPRGSRASTRRYPCLVPYDDGYFGPESVSWQVHREVTVLFGGARAMLMQAAHPLVIAGPTRRGCTNEPVDTAPANAGAAVRAHLRYQGRGACRGRSHQRRPRTHQRSRHRDRTPIRRAGPECSCGYTPASSRAPCCSSG